MLNLFLRPLFATLPFALLSLGACTISVNEGHGHGPGHDSGSDHDDGSDEPEEPEDLTELCIDLQIECLEDAENSNDVEACGALFDHCAAPQACVGECSAACSAHSLSGCLGSHIDCSGAAESADDLEDCADNLDQCTENLGNAQCLPSGDSELLDACLKEHSLCISIGFGDPEEQEKVCSAALATCTGAS